MALSPQDGSSIARLTVPVCSWDRQPAATTMHHLGRVRRVIAFHLQRAVVLQGEDIIKQWQTQLSPYPEELAIAMIQKHLKFRPFDGQHILTERLEIPMLYENKCAIVRRLLNILFGLNRIYHPGFKWTRYWAEEMSIKPFQCTGTMLSDQ
jgi:Domain of unknown function (DUF4037)